MALTIAVGPAQAQAADPAPMPAQPESVAVPSEGVSEAAPVAPQPPGPVPVPGSTPPLGPSPVPGGVPVVSPRVREVRPETYYLPDKDGNLVPVLNMPYEEFDRLLQLDLKQHATAAALPSYSLQELSIQGTAENRRATLSVAVTVRLLADGWVRVPLRFADAVLREVPQRGGDGNEEWFIAFEGRDSGYVCWVRGAKEKLHKLTLEIAVPVRQVGSEHRLALQAPRATSSQLDLQVPLPQAAAVVSSGLLEVQSEQDRTHFQVAGLGGDFQITWRSGTAQLANPRALLEVISEQTVKVDGERQVTADVRLKVGSLRGEFDSFDVRLPPGGRLYPRQFSQSGLQLIELPEAEKDTGKVVQVKLDRSVRGPIDVQLLAELTPVAGTKGTEYDLTGFEVSDAFRQSGVIDFMVKENLSVSWKPGATVQRSLVPEALRQKVTARFDVTQRSSTLRMQVAPKAVQWSVEPLYLLYVHAGRVRLDGTLKYRVRGAELSSVAVQLRGWSLLRVSPENLIDLETFDRSRLDPLTVPLIPSTSPSGGELTLRLEAEQELTTPGKLSVVLPRPEARSPSQALVVVLPADNVELAVNEDSLKGLEREPFPPSLSLPPIQRSPLYLRERGDAAEAVFSATLTVRPRSVSIDTAATVQLAPQVARVEQRFQYRVAYEPLRQVEFLVPRTLLETAGIKFVSQQQALPFVTADAASGSGTDAASGADLLVQVDPLREVIGPLELAVQYDHPVPSIAPGQEIELPLPLVRPPARDGVITAGISLQVKSSPNLRCSVSDEIWEPGLGAESPGNGQLTRTAARLPSEVALRVSRSDQPQQASTVVLQSWILTCLGSSLRHERAVFRVRTNQPEIGVQLPVGAQVERVGLDGRDVTAFAGGGGGKIAVALAPDPTASDHVLEVWYQTPSTRSWSWFRTIDLPQVAGATAIQQRYWTVATPPGLHLATGPSGWTPELVWRWQGWYWGRRARLRPDQLERWAGASVQPLPLADGENEYLLSRFGSDQTPLVCTVVSRGAVLGLVSGCVLVLGLLAMYSSLGRHPAVLFVGGLGLLWLMLWQPDVALVVAQLSGLGLGLLACGWCLKLWVDRRRAGATVIQGATLPTVDSKTLRAAPLPSDSRRAVTPATATAPPSAALHVAESKP